jgi:hypothetical protein
MARAGNPRLRKIPQRSKKEAKKRRKMYEMSSKRIHEILKDAIDRHIFSTRVVYADDGVKSMTSMFGFPYVVWVPETRYGQPNGRPKCVNGGCTCIPEPSNYLTRKVHDVDHITVL